MCGMNPIVKIFKKLAKIYFCVKFDCLKSLEDFANKDHYFNNKLLTCKVQFKTEQYMQEQFELFLKPRRVFISMVPKTTTKNQVKKKFTNFGAIEDISLNINENSSYNYSFIVYENFQSAINAIEAKTLTIAKGKDVKIILARPKVSNKFIELVKSPLNSMVKDIIMDNVPFDHQDFYKVYQSTYDINWSNPDKNIYEQKQGGSYNKNNSSEEKIPTGFQSVEEKHNVVYIKDEVIKDLDEILFDHSDLRLKNCNHQGAVYVRKDNLQSNDDYSKQKNAHDCNYLPETFDNNTIQQYEPDNAKSLSLNKGKQKNAKKKARKLRHDYEKFMAQDGKCPFSHLHRKMPNTSDENSPSHFHNNLGKNITQKKYDTTDVEYTLNCNDDNYSQNQSFYSNQQYQYDYANQQNYDLTNQMGNLSLHDDTLHSNYANNYSNIDQPNQESNFTDQYENYEQYDNYDQYRSQGNNRNSNWEVNLQNEEAIGRQNYSDCQKKIHLQQDYNCIDNQDMINYGMNYYNNHYQVKNIDHKDSELNYFEIHESPKKQDMTYDSQYLPYDPTNYTAYRDDVYNNEKNNSNTTSQFQSDYHDDVYYGNQPIKNSNQKNHFSNYNSNQKSTDYYNSCYNEYANKSEYQSNPFSNGQYYYLQDGENYAVISCAKQSFDIDKSHNVIANPMADSTMEQSNGQYCMKQKEEFKNENFSKIEFAYEGQER